MNTSKNIMGTTSFSHKFTGMRKEQEFIIYPMKEKSDSIKIQSDTRIGTIDLNTGEVSMSKPHSNGAYFIHLSFDKMTPSILSSDDLDTLKQSIRETAGHSVGNSFVLSDNSGASLI